MLDVVAYDGRLRKEHLLKQSHIFPSLGVLDDRMVWISADLSVIFNYQAQ